MNDKAEHHAPHHAAPPAPAASAGGARGTAAGGARPMGELLELAADQALPVVRAIPDDLLTAATPCTEYDVRTLLNHLFHVLVQFRHLAAKQNGEFGTPPDYVGEGADWRERFTTAAEELIAAWSRPGAEEGTTGSMNLPARTVGSMALLDLTVHAWDLARATGQDFRPAAGALSVLWQLREAVAELAPTARRMGVFGEPFTLPDDAAGGTDPTTELDRLLAATGRNPGWTVPVGA